MKIYRGIRELVTGLGIRKKSGRHVVEEDLDMIRRAAIVESDGLIRWVGEEKKLTPALIRSLRPKKGMLKEIVLNAECVVPAFLDCHSHTVFAGDRSHEFELRNRGLTYKQIASQGGGINFTVEQTRQSSERELLRLAEARAQNYLKQGVTTVEIKSGYGLNEESELKILRVIKKIQSVRAVATYLGPHAWPKDISREEYFKQMLESTLPKIAKSKLAQRVDMFIEEGYYDASQAQRYYKRAQELGFKIVGHLDQMTRSSFVAELVQMAAISLDHLVYSEEQDWQALAKSETTAVLLPTSDLYLRMAYPKARQMCDAGVRVALATDFNPGTAPSQDFSLLGLLARLEMKMSLPEVLAGVTYNSAHALGLQSELGSLEFGKRCDWVAFECSWRELFYSVGYHPVLAVARDGQVNLKKT